LVPGFVDGHIHGAFGIDFMTASDEEMALLCEKLAEVGYEAFLPTTVTAPLDAVRSSLDHLIDHPMIVGFHLEGPFISPEFPGAQPPSEIRNPPVEASEWDFILNDSRLKVITLAPELPFALELTTRLMRQGVRVSMGHTNATFEEARRGSEFGAVQTTHTFNAMRGFHHREAGIAGFALASPSLDCELIYDRHHVCRDSAGLLLKNKPADRILAVSDSTQATGLPAGTKLTMWGLDCVVEKGQIRLASNGALAGSAITLMDAFRNLSQDFGPEVAIRACCLNPRRALGIRQIRRYLLFDQDLRLKRTFEAEW
jgi:N-acetylglucosamine-6-phosphate deacetylase